MGKKIYEKECQYCGKNYNTTDPNALFCGLECYGKHYSETKAKERIEKCKRIIESRGTEETINIEMTYNKDRGDIFTIKCLKCGGIENISTRVISTGKYKGCKKCYEKHCRVCGEIIHGYWKEDICKECKKKQKINEKKKKCIYCGKEFFHYKNDMCQECVEEFRKMRKLYKKTMQESKKEYKTQICECCGKEFYPQRYGLKYCSKHCMKKASNKRKDILRDKRLKENGEIDNSITLEKLYKRDNGICKICGGKCNYDDCRIDENNNFIVGNDYPSIDHIIPISKGGKHVWENVQLAHLRCNSIKNNKV